MGAVDAWRRRGRPSSTSSPSTTPTTSRSTRRRSARCAGSSARARSRYIGQELLQTDIDNLKAAIEGYDVADVFMPSTGPERVRAQRVLRHARGVPPRRRRGDARGVPRHRRRRLHPPGRRPVADRHAERPDDGAGGARRGSPRIHVEALNHALRGIPTGPDPPPHLLRPQPRAAHERHPADRRRAVHAGDQRRRVLASRSPTRGTMHEWRIWEDVKLPDGKILIPGLHRPRQQLRRAPRADRRLHRASTPALVGKENVIAGADCGFSSRASYAPEVHPTVVWPKFRALAKAPPSPPRPSGANPPAVPPSAGHLNLHRRRSSEGAGVRDAGRPRRLGRAPAALRPTPVQATGVSHPLPTSCSMQAGAERAVAALAASQHGAFGNRQAAERGVTEKDRRVTRRDGDSGSIAERGVLVVAGTPDTWRQRLMIAVLAGGRRRVVIARPRRLHQLDGFEAQRPLEVSVVARTDARGCRASCSIGSRQLDGR